ncbi:hypothetical protein H0H87_012870 [Tephrocybe sp. NHM501043]|nr:hypothetical protein H0H87_012870 [Tephrocybe sp. NHM501043]
MRCFRLEDYAGLSKGIDNEARFINRCHAILTILNAAKAIKGIQLPGIHKSLRKEFVHILSSMQGIEHCTIYDRDSHMGQIYDFTIGEIQQFIANWTNLRKNFDEEVPELQCQIKSLTLRTSHLTGRQFIRFSSPRLSTVELERVNGPNNRDLFLFLSISAASLTNLKVRGCEFKFQDAGEEHAIDEIMPKLCALEELVVSGNLLSTLAIARKAQGQHSSFTATLVPELYIEELVDALDTSGWTVVTIKTLTGVTDDDDLWMKQQALDTAARRNIMFTYEPLF